MTTHDRGREPMARKVSPPPLDPRLHRHGDRLHTHSEEDHPHPPWFRMMEEVEVFRRRTRQ